MTRILPRSIAVLTLMLSGCFGDTKKDIPVNQSILTPTDSSNCVNELNTGKCYATTIDGVERYFYVIRPSSFDPDNGLLLVLHGLGDTIEWQNEWFYATQVAERTGKLLVLGKGTVLTGPARTGKIVWNATAACCYFDKLVAREYIPDDIAFIERMMDLSINEYDLDPDATVLWGYSNGAFMSNSFACTRSSRVAALITQSGAMRADVNECKPENAVSEFHIHGTLDQSIAFAGDTTDRDVFEIWKGFPGLYTRAFYPGASEITDTWLARNECDDTPTTEAGLTNFTTHDNVRYLNDYTTIPETEQTVSRDAVLRRYSGCRDGVTVQSLVVEEGKHKPQYNADSYVQIVSDFITSNGKRTITPVADVQDRSHDDVNDSSASIVPLTGSGLFGGALFRILGNGEYFVRAGFSQLIGKDITAIRLLDSDDVTLGSASGASIFNTNRYAYSTMTATGTPAKLQVVVDDITLTGLIELNNSPYSVDTTLTASGGREATVTVKAIASTRLNYSVHVNDAFDPETITNIRIVSPTKTINLYPIPSGLPDPDDYDGEYSFWEIVKTGGFAFVANETDGGFDVSGFAEAKGSFPYYYEEFVGDPLNYDVIITLEGGEELTMPMGSAPG